MSIDFLGRAVSEPLLIGIAAGYEAATHHRRPPHDFGPVEKERSRKLAAYGSSSLSQ